MSSATPRIPAPATRWDALVRTSGLPRLDAQALLEHVSGRPREWLLAHGDEAADAQASERFHDLAERRRHGEPLAYLLGWREFYGRRFTVSPAVLIPRPDTELLLEAALACLPSTPAAPLQALELGTGSGIIAITLALARPGLAIMATDVSAAALSVAQRNARELGAPGIRFAQGSWWEALPAGSTAFDVIVSNPPYIAEQDPHLTDPALRHEPRQALACGPLGLDALHVIITGAARQLRPGGWLLVEHGYDQGPAVRQHCAATGFQDIVTLPDLQGHERVTRGRWPQPQ